VLSEKLTIVTRNTTRCNVMAMMVNINDSVCLKWRFFLGGGQNTGRGGAILTPNELAFPSGSS